MLLKKALPYTLPALIGLALLPIPLLRDFHFESAILAGVVGCFWAGIRATNYSAKQDFFTSLKILVFIYIAGLPLFIYSLFTSCLTIDGIGFWVFIPVPSVFFGAAIGRLIRKFWFPFPKTITTLILIFVGFGVWLFEFLNFPQVYFYNHVWGIWPGPIYDESVLLSGSFFYFRWLTFLWIVLLWVLPGWSKNAQTKLITGLAFVSLVFSYLNLDEAGIISPRESIQYNLGGYHQAEHFDIYFDEEFYTQEEIEYWSLRHEFHFTQVTQLLDIDWPSGRRIESYLYAHAWQKKKITGAKFTSYVPLWLEQDQLHIAKQQLDKVLKHELVHVISKQFGNRLYNGSWSIGLIEGLAVGIAKDASEQTTLHQIVAAEKPHPTAGEMKTALSFSGFYGRAGAISYTTAGSFVDYLLEEYPVGYFKKSYPLFDFESAYPLPFEALVSGWHQTLDAVKVDPIDRRVSEFIFAQRSLFQKTCPHFIPKELQLWDQYLFLKANYDTSSAYRVLDELYTLDSKNSFLKSEWARAQLSQKKFAPIIQSISDGEPSLTLRLLKADALFLNEEFERADSLLLALMPELKASNEQNFRYSPVLREDRVQWDNHVRRSYFNVLPDSALFETLNLPNKMLSLDKALQQKNVFRSKEYAKLLTFHAPDAYWFDIYETTAHLLAYWEETGLAEQWIDLTAALDLRLRYIERLDEQRQWLNFIKNKNDVAD